ncbi:MAG: 30S ribosomal protein S5 [Candidatus Woesearchaeota archaeon]|jgi:small subunit ribosomal protein S5|nr:30S ribosomal protein S5 [Candidatus Woesearchaeota archaeon]
MTEDKKDEEQVKEETVKTEDNKDKSPEIKGGSGPTGHRRNDSNKRKSSYGRDRGKPVAFDKEGWKPRTSLGEQVKKGDIKDIDEILDNGIKYIEPEIVDCFFPDAEIELLLVGQSKGKFGGGQRRVFKQTQKKTREGNKPKFATTAAMGNKNGYIGIGYGKSKETVPAREKAMRNAKLSLIKVRRGCGSWECGCKTAHSIPFKVQGKCGSVIITLIPAPKGTGLCINGECKKMLALAGIKDVWSNVIGKTATSTNLIKACFKALKQLMIVKIKPDDVEKLGIIEGSMKSES